MSIIIEYMGAKTHRGKDQKSKVHFIQKLEYYISMLPVETLEATSLCMYISIETGLVTMITCVSVSIATVAKYGPSLV